jgi:hypothetical protein
MSLNQRPAMRGLLDLDLFFITARLETALGLVVGDVETVSAAEFDEEKNGELTPMSPWNHAQVLASAACVNAIAAIDVMNIVFIGVY